MCDITSVLSRAASEGEWILRRRGLRGRLSSGRTAGQRGARPRAVVGSEVTASSLQIKDLRAGKDLREYLNPLFLSCVNQGLETMISLRRHTFQELGLSLIISLGQK